MLDPIKCSRTEIVRKVIKANKNKFDLHDLVFRAEILGSQITRNADGITLKYREKEREIIAEFQTNNSEGLTTPLPPSLKLPELVDIADVVFIERYRPSLRKLLHISKCVKCEIYFAVNLLAIQLLIQNNLL